MEIKVHFFFLLIDKDQKRREIMLALELRINSERLKTVPVTTLTHAGTQVTVARKLTSLLVLGSLHRMFAE